MANFEGDSQQAAILGSKLLEKIDPNLIDKEGKSPLHVAIKKEQLLALKFALQTNKFNLDVKGRGGRTLLHYSVKKAQSNMFLELVRAGVDFLAKDNTYHTARHLSLINTSYYKILFRMEKVQIRGKLFVETSHPVSVVKQEDSYTLSWQQQEQLPDDDINEQPAGSE